jgi:hypothetical protein
MEKSKLDTIKELYKSLSPKEKISFDRFYGKIKEWEKLEMLEARINVAKNLISIGKENGQPYFSTDWIIKNVLKEN